jgi:cell division protein FtsW (lipid II flippase)
METKKEILLNGMSINFFIAMLLCALAGVLVFFLSDVNDAVKYDNRSPNKFNFWYMLRTSGARLLMGLIVLCFAIVYFPDMSKLVFQVEEPLQINGFVAFVMGIGADLIVKKVVGYGKRPTQYLFNKITQK